MLDQTSAEGGISHISQDGLTYHHKAGGSPFSGSPALLGQTMSCFFCGRHRPRAMLRSRLLLGRHQAVCAPSCKAAGA
ncbi:MAG: hypothetical protein WAQ05_11595 [Rubrivivax sp.]